MLELLRPESLLKKGTLSPRKSWRSSPETRTRNKNTTPWTLCCITKRSTFDNFDFDNFLTLINSSPVQESLAAPNSSVHTTAWVTFSGRTSNINECQCNSAQVCQQWVFWQYWHTGRRSDGNVGLALPLCHTLRPGLPRSSPHHLAWPRLVSWKIATNPTHFYPRKSCKIKIPLILLSSFPPKIKIKIQWGDTSHLK